jgi:hypothetical protein
VVPGLFEVSHSHLSIIILRALRAPGHRKQGKRFFPVPEGQKLGSKVGLRFSRATDDPVKCESVLAELDLNIRLTFGFRY